MQYPRKCHSSCVVANRYVVCTGSVFEGNRADATTELYDTQDDTWMELARLNTPRCFHSSCDRNGEFVYVFAGKSKIGRAINSVERMKIKDENGMSWRNQWMKLELPAHEFPDLFSPRSTPGVCAVSDRDLLLFGGRVNGKSLSDYYLISTYPQTGGFKDIKKHTITIYDEETPIWPYEVTTISDTSSRIAYTVDWMTKRLFMFKDGKFDF